MRSIAFLNFDQPLGAKAKTFVDKETAEELVHEMFAERISAKVIRAFSPDSAFRNLRPIPVRLRRKFKMPPREVENCYFVPPATDKRPRIAALRAGWDWSRELPPEDMRVHA